MAGRDSGQSEEPVGGPRAGEFTSIYYYVSSRQAAGGTLCGLAFIVGPLGEFQRLYGLNLAVERDSLPITGRSKQMLHCGAATFSTKTSQTKSTKVVDKILK